MISIHAPLTGSDLEHGSASTRWTDFNPRSPYGERPHGNYSKSSSQPFQSTLPLRGATAFLSPADREGRFQSTLPLRGATIAAFPALSISSDFNPRSPYGERRISICLPAKMAKFQSTLPLRGATIVVRPLDITILISIHAPLTGSDITKPARQARLQHFNPRSPYGERLVALFHLLCGLYFNPRSPYGERRGCPCFFWRLS